MAGQIRLHAKYKVQLMKFIHENHPGANLQLIYKASRDGFNANAFHERCDGLGPTVTIVYAKNGYIFGGKVDIPWDGPEEENTYVTDEDAYLFQLKPKTIKRKAVEAHGKQVLHHKNIGPAFGDDLILFKGDVGAGEATASQSTKTNGTAGDPAAYEKKDGWRPSFDLLDIEVCEITEENIDMLEDDDAFAAKVEPGERDDLMKKIRTYVPPKSVRTSFARLLLLGPVGAGKSSFINTVNSAFRERITQKASSGSTNYSLTQRYQVYEVRPDREEPPLNFRLCDTMGIEPEDGKGLLVEDVPFVLDGSMHEGTEFNPARPVSANKDRLIQGATILNKIHCAAVFVNANTLSFMSPELRKKLKQLCKHIMDADIPLVGLLTHIDDACPHVKKDLSLTYKSETIVQRIEDLSAIIGTPETNIFPVKNYSRGYKTDVTTDTLALRALWSMLQFADDFFEKQPDYGQDILVTSPNLNKEFEEKMKVAASQVWCERKVHGNTEVHQCADELVRKVNSSLEEKSIQLAVSEWGSGKRSNNTPVLVVCPNVTGRLDVDVGRALEGTGGRDVVLVVMHHVQPQSTGHGTFNGAQNLATRVGQNTVVVDVLFFSGKGVYDCPTNKEAVQKLAQYFGK